MMRLLYVLISVGATRFELAASSSQNWHSTGLSYTPNLCTKNNAALVYWDRLQI
jgi:hypothetical protein